MCHKPAICRQERPNGRAAVGLDLRMREGGACSAEQVRDSLALTCLRGRELCCIVQIGSWIPDSLFDTGAHSTAGQAQVDLVAEAGEVKDQCLWARHLQLNPQDGARLLHDREGPGVSCRSQSSREIRDRSSLV